VWPSIMSTAVLTAVDHIVVRVSDLGAAVDTYRRLGFSLIHVPSSNGEEAVAYAVFGEFHLEFRATADGLSREGLHTLALRTDDIGADVARLRSVGLQVSDPVDDTAGMAPRRSAEVAALIPILLVEHDTTTDELDAGAGHPEPHPNTVTNLERTYIAVESIDRELRAFEDVFGVPAPEPEMGTVIMSMMSVFYLGEIGIAVAEPRGAGPTADALTANGPGMFQILFRAQHLDLADSFMVEHGIPAPARGTRLSGESALLVSPENACGAYVAMAGNP
jgi:catechol 2,3-dioxygenase-like lactoylglutathione lyase family enzyme